MGQNQVAFLGTPPTLAPGPDALLLQVVSLVRRFGGGLLCGFRSARFTPCDCRI